MELINTINQWDKSFFLFLNSFHNSTWDYMMTLFTLTPTWFPFYGMILFFIGKKFGKKSLIVFVAITLLLVCADQFAGIIKHTVQRLRPSNDPVIGPLANVFYKKGGEYGFVSAHAANALSFATFSILLFRNRLYTSFIIPWACIIAYSRIYLGVHYPGDILGGAILGILIGIGVYKLLVWVDKRYMPTTSIQKNTLKQKEAIPILVSGAFVFLMCLLIIWQMITNDLVFH